LYDPPSNNSTPLDTEKKKPTTASLDTTLADYIRDVLPSDVRRSMTSDTKAEYAYNTLATEIEEFLQRNETDNAYEVLVTMRRFELKPTKEFYEKVLVNFATNKAVPKVNEVLLFMQRDDVIADEKTHMMVVRAYSDIKEYEWVKKAFLKMCDTVKPSAKAYEDVIEFFAKEQRVAVVRKAEEVFYTAHKHDVRPTARTCFLFVQHLVNTNYEGDVDRAIEVLKFMKVKHIEANPHIIGVFRRHLKTLEPPRQFIRMKKVLRGLQHGGFPDEKFIHYWRLVNAKKWIHKIQRAELAPP
jgi:hypothetical protein